MDAAAAASTVRIAVNDVSGSPMLFAGVDNDLLVPLRAVKSLSRLDAVLRAEKRAADDVASPSEMLAAYHLAYKCPSFPRIDRYSSMDEMRLVFDADSMSPRLSNATLSQDLDAELFAMSISNLCVPSEQTSLSRHDAILTRSVSARTIRLTPTAAATGATLSNLLSPPDSATTTAVATTTSMCRRLTRSTSCPSISLPLHLSPSPSSLLHALPASFTSAQHHSRTIPGGTVQATSMTAGKGRAQFDSDVDLDSEHVTDLPVIATLTDLPVIAYLDSKHVTDLPDIATMTDLPVIAHLDSEHVTDLPVTATLTDLPVIATLTDLPDIAYLDSEHVTDLPVIATLTDLPAIAISTASTSLIYLS